MEKVFEKITRKKIWFSTPKGNLSIEDVWDLPLTGNGLNLDDLAKELNKEVQDSRMSFVNPGRGNEEASLKLEAVIYIIDTKIEEAERRAEARKAKERKQKLLEILEEKELKRLSKKKAEDIKEELRELDEIINSANI